MSSKSQLLNLIKADFLERIRRYSFLVTIVFMILIGFTIIPSIESNALTIDLGNLRGEYNSAWIGGVITLQSTMLLSLPGFYLVKNCISRDQETKTGLIIASTQVSKTKYILGKSLSNFLYLVSIISIVCVTSGFMQLIRGESASFEIWKLTSPFILIVLPVMAVISSAAILFESIPLLRKGFGNAIFFALYLFTLIFSLSSIEFSQQGTILQAGNDIFGAGLIGKSMLFAANEAFPGRPLDFGIGYTIVKGQINTFSWNGISWNIDLVFSRLLWYVLAILLTFLAALCFNRFDPARIKDLHRKTKTKAKKFNKQVNLNKPSFLNINLLPYGLFWSELRLLFKSAPWWWYLVAIGLITASYSSQNPIPILLICWIWPLLIWSKTGLLNNSLNLEALIKATPRSGISQLATNWLASFILTIMIGSGALIQFLQQGNWQQIAAWLSAAIFIPSLAMILATLSGTSKTFEALYLMLWYLGPVNGIPFLDFIGAHHYSLENHIYLNYLMIGIATFLFSFICKYWRNQLK